MVTKAEAVEHVEDLAIICERQAGEIVRLRQALERISSPTQTKGLLWWQIEARAALGKGPPLALTGG